MRLAAVLLLLVIGAGWLALRSGPGPAIGDRIATVQSLAGLAGDGGDLKVAVFGSSLARRAEWPARIDGAPAPCGPGRITVTVTGIAGAGSRDGLTLVEQSPPANHDIVVLEYAINDADILDGISRSDSRANHRRMIAALRGANPDVAIILMATNPVRGLQRLKRPRLAGYYSDYVRLAEETGVSLFDGTARWRSAGVDRRSLPDGLHPDPAVEAALYQEPLLDMIARIAEPVCRQRYP